MEIKFICRSCNDEQILPTHGMSLEAFIPFLSSGEEAIGTAAWRTKPEKGSRIYKVFRHCNLCGSEEEQLVYPIIKMRDEMFNHCMDREKARELFCRLAPVLLGKSALRKGSSIYLIDRGGLEEEPFVTVPKWKEDFLWHEGLRRLLGLE
jgi:hypothetical protein